MRFNKFAPAQGEVRIGLMDALRGLALLGIIIANIPVFSGYLTLTDAQVNAAGIAESSKWFAVFIQIMVDTKFITLFSLLFGAGFYLQLEKAKKGDIAFKQYFIIRMLLLLLIGCLHAYLLWSGDILRYYAVAGLLLLFFTKAGSSKLLKAGLMVSLILTPVVFIQEQLFPFYADPEQINGVPMRDYIYRVFSEGSFKDVLSLVQEPVKVFFLDSGLTVASMTGKILIGFWLAKTGFFTQPQQFKTMLRKWRIWGLVFGIPCSIAFWAINAGKFSIDSYWMLWIPFVVAAGLIAHSLLYLSLFVQAYNSGFFRKLCNWFAAVGKLSLTNYLLQTVICIFIFYAYANGFRLYGKVGPLGFTGIALAIYAVQVIFSNIWLRYSRFGPVEWVWRKMAYSFARTRKQEVSNKKVSITLVEEIR